MDLINPQIEQPTIDQLRGQWLALAGQCRLALDAWVAAWMTYVSTDPGDVVLMDDTHTMVIGGTYPIVDGRAEARQRAADRWTEYVAVSAQADRAWHDYDGAVDAR